MNDVKKGISLVALIITIVVLIILTGVVILITNQGDIIGKSKKTVFKSDIKTFQEELRKSILDKQVESGGSLSKSDVNAIEFEAQGNGTGIKDWIPSITEEYRGKLEVEEGELIYVDDNNTEQEKELLEELAIKRKVNSDDFRFSYNTENMTATVTGLSTQGRNKIATEVTTLKIPDRVIKDGQSFVVTSIGQNAFVGCTSITELTVPWASGTIANEPWGLRAGVVHYVS